jgi:hypothetical protein
LGVFWGRLEVRLWYQLIVMLGKVYTDEETGERG